MTLYSAYAPGALEVGRLIPAAVGILFCVLGNYMPKFKPNYFVGIRTPWTLASENVWRRTHRLSGLLWFFGGLLYFVISLLIKPASAFPITIVVLLVIAVLPCAASYFYWRQEQKGNSSDGSFSKWTDPVFLFCRFSLSIRLLSGVTSGNDTGFCRVFFSSFGRGIRLCALFLAEVSVIMNLLQN